MKRKYSIITVLMILAAFGLLYLMSKSESVSGKQNEFEQKMDDLEFRIEDKQNEFEQRIDDLESRIENIRQ